MRVAMIVLAVLCLGPAPGEVGACGDDNVVADPVDFCTQTGAWECRRMEARGDISDIQSCVDSIDCEGTQWPFDCQPFPTNRQAEACIDQLKIAGNVDTPQSEIAECRLCR